MQKLINTLSCAALAITIVGCATIDTTQRYKNLPPAQIYHDGEKALSKSEYKQAIEHFEALDSLYPFDEHIEQTRLDTIYAHYKRDEPEEAIAAADRFIHLYPRSPHVDYAFYLRGITAFYQGRPVLQRIFPTDPAQRDLSGAKDAFRDFSIIVTRFPSSPYAPDARKRMVYLREILAKHELVIAQFYLRIHAYVAAANRANNIIQHYQHAPATVDALAIMVESYRHLGLNDLADNTLAILKKSYPTAPALKRLA